MSEFKPASKPGDESLAALDVERAYAALREALAAALAKRAQAPFLVGIHSGGAWVAARLHRDLKLSTPLGFLSSAFHRDDYNRRGLPANIQPTKLPFDVAGAQIVLVDDILYTGRTIRAVLNEIYDYGRPNRVELAVLIDRGGRQLPIQPDFCGAVNALPAEHNYVLTQRPGGEFSIAIE